MVDIRTIQPIKYNLKLAEALKELDEFEEPHWVKLVKTSHAKERPNIDPDFWHKRAAGILRQIYIRGIVGTERLRSRYGNRKMRGMRPPHFIKAGGKIIRTILQQSDKAGLTEKAAGKKSGRQLTKQGRDLLEEVAGEMK